MRLFLFLIIFVYSSDAYAGDNCASIIERIKKCQVYSCTMRDKARDDLVADHYVKGLNKDGLCNYVQTLSYTPSQKKEVPIIDCLYDQKTRFAVANILERAMSEEIFERDADSELLDAAMKKGACRVIRPGAEQ